MLVLFFFFVFFYVVMHHGCAITWAGGAFTMLRSEHFLYLTGARSTPWFGVFISESRAGMEDCRRALVIYCF